MVKATLEEEAHHAFSLDDNDVVSYTFDVTSGKDISASYDSKEGILKNNLKDNNSEAEETKSDGNKTDNNSEGDETKSDDNKTLGNNSNIIKVSKYFNLLFLILL